MKKAEKLRLAIAEVRDHCKDKADRPATPKMAKVAYRDVVERLERVLYQEAPR